ncbi:MAG: SusC/RagA family TonB-linked outer membrane protein [Muribaculaceae bacterium]|nr:SusC/RagA family TonB-linked outer membrane protein [Muribaculaceae bacterium]
MISIYKKYLPAAMLASMMAVAPAVTAQEEADTTATPMVQLAYRQVAADEVLGGAETINIADLMKKNYINDLNGTTLKGYVPGYNGNSLWGSDANDGRLLVLIDGVPRDMNNIPPIEVESVTFLKGAQAVLLYGSRAAEGAVYITTKRGHDGDLKIDAHASTGWAVAKRLPEYLNSASYMTLYNEARVNDGLDPLYSAEDIYNTASGVNPFRYPDVDMYSKDYVRRTFNRTDGDLEISGGNQRARFYTNINYYRYGDYLKVGESKNNYTDRFSVRGNVDVDIVDAVSAYVNAAATFYGSHSAVCDNDKFGNYWSAANTFRPNRVSPFIPISMINPGALAALELVNNSSNLQNGMFPGGTISDPNNIFSEYNFAGDSKFTSRQFQFDAGVNVDLASVTKGLTFNAKFGIDYATSYTTSYNNKYATFVPVWQNFNGKDEIVSISQEGKDEHSGVQNISGSTSRQTINFSAQFDYARRWADVHNFHAMVVAAGWQRTFSGEYHKTSSVNLGFEADYNYDKRYYAEFGLTGVHSSRLAPGHRQGWSPSGTIGWRLSQEEWLKDSEAVNELMISASASKLKTDLYLTDYYMYSANYTNGGWYSWAPGGQAAAYPKRGANENLTFIDRTEFSANIRGDFFNNALSLNASFFTHKLSGLPINNSTKFPTFFSTYYPASSFVPWLNWDANRRTGYDFGITGRKQFGDVYLELGVNATYYKTKATKRDEIHEDAYQNAVGKPVDAIWGYRCLGFFKTDEEAASVDQSALGSAELKAGDLRYEDVNKDGVVDSKDRVYLGRGGWYGDPFTLGVNLTAKYKGFTLFVHCTGSYGAKSYKTGSYYRPAGENKYSSYALDRWTPANANSATLPRLTTTNANNNNRDSDFWLYSRDRFEIAKVQLTYDFPTHLFSGKVVKGISLFLSGDDLVMFGKNRKIMETTVGGSPQYRFYNFGAQVTF